MDDIPWEQVIIAGSTLLASLGGYLLAGWNDSRRDRRTNARDRSTRNEDRRDAAAQTRHNFQLETLLTLQEAVQRMTRLTTRALFIDHMQARAGKTENLPDDLDADLLANALNVGKLRSRILDAELRAAIETFISSSRDAVNSTGMYASQTGESLEILALSHSAQYAAHAQRTMELLGKTIRTELDWTPEIR